MMKTRLSLGWTGLLVLGIGCAVGCGSAPEDLLSGSQASRAAGGDQLPPGSTSSNAGGNCAPSLVDSASAGCSNDSKGGGTNGTTDGTGAGTGDGKGSPSGTSDDTSSTGDSCKTDVFAGAAPYRAPNIMTPGFLPDNVPVHGQRCMDCHTNPSQPGQPKFDFGGRVYDANGMPLAHAQVQVGSGTEKVDLYSNAQGYFWWPPPPPGGYGGGMMPPNTVHPTFPANAGARNAVAKSSMCAAAENGNCDSCHDGKTQPLIAVH
jgi:hypothetical protein